MRALLLTLACGLGVPSPPAAPQEAAADARADGLGPGERAAVAREWTTRRWAGDPQGAGAELLEALGAAEWTARHAALEACERALATGQLLAPALVGRARALLRDPHPDVRVGALRCLAALGSDAELEADAARAAATHALPAVRLALAEALETLRCPAAPELLAALCGDPDARVAEAARRALFTLPAERAAAPAKLEALAELASRAGPEALRELAGWLMRAEPDAAFLDGGRARLPATGSTPWRAAFAALATGALGASDAPVARPRVTRTELAELLAVPSTHPLVGFAARARDPALTADLIGLLDGAQGLEEEACATLVAALVEECDLLRVVTLARRADVSATTWTRLLPELGLALPSWKPLVASGALAGWWAPAAPAELRHALLSGLEWTLSLRADPAAGGLLADAVTDDDEDLARRAFRAVASALPAVDVDRREAWGRALATAWERLPEDERRERCGWLPPGALPAAFRAPLARWGARPEARDRAAELLATYAGDPEALRVLGAWLEEDLARLTATPPAAPAGSAAGGARPATPATPDAQRALERRIVGELRALARVAPTPPVDALERGLGVARGRSVEVGKAAAALLGASAAGRARLAPWLARLDSIVDGRTRVEVAIARLGGDGPRPDAEAEELLVEELARAGSRLSVRMVAALGRGGTERSLAFLEVLARDGRARFEDRLAAVDALAMRGAVSALEACVAEAGRPDLVRAALHALARVDDPRAVGVLVQRFDRIEAEATGVGADDAYHQLVRADLLGLLAGMASGGTRPALDARLERAFLRLPLARAETRLAAAFRGAAPERGRTDWAGELELARQWARGGRLDALLARTPGLERLDGRLLAALAEVTRRAGGDDAALTVRAAIALAGCPDPAAWLDRAHARRRLLQQAWADERWDAFRRLAGRALLERRRGTWSASAWAAAFGRRDRAAGVDPAARLAAGMALAEGWQALASGGTARAREALERAASAVGDSHAARGDVERLRRALEPAAMR